MKLTTILTAAIVATFSTSAFGADLIRSNVPSSNGSVPGFVVLGKGYFVEAAYADRAIVDATVLPAGVNSKDLGEVMAYLASVGIDATARLAGDDTERETVVSLDDEGNEVTSEIVTTSRAVNGGW